jgi:hypothetical protein
MAAGPSFRSRGVMKRAFRLSAECTNGAGAGLGRASAISTAVTSPAPRNAEDPATGSSTIPHSLWMNPSDEGCVLLWKN